MPRNTSKSPSFRKAAGAQLNGVVQGAVRRFSYPSKVRSLTAISMPSTPKSKSAKHSMPSVFHYRNEAASGGEGEWPKASSEQTWSDVTTSITAPTPHNDINRSTQSSISHENQVSGLPVIPEAKYHHTEHGLAGTAGEKATNLSIPDPQPYSTPDLRHGRSISDIAKTANSDKQVDAVLNNELESRGFDPSYRRTPSSLQTESISPTEQPQVMDMAPGIKKASLVDASNQIENDHLDEKKPSSTVSPVKQVLNWVAADPAWNSDRKENPQAPQTSSQKKQFKADQTSPHQTVDNEKLLAIAKHLAKVSAVSNLNQLSVTDGPVVKSALKIKPQAKVATFPQSINVSARTEKHSIAVGKSRPSHVVVVPKATAAPAPRAYRHTQSSTSGGEQAAAREVATTPTSAQTKTPKTRVIREIVTVRKQTPRSSRPTRGFIQRSHLTQMLWRRIR